MGQGTHAPEAESQVKPGRQRSQAAAPSPEVAGGKQTAQTVAPPGGAAAVPAAQGSHKADPGAAWKQPAGQVAHAAEEPWDAAPGGQGAQPAAGAAEGRKVPGAHPWQPLPPGIPLRPGGQTAQDTASPALYAPGEHAWERGRRPGLTVGGWQIFDGGMFWVSERGHKREWRWRV